MVQQHGNRYSTTEPVAAEDVILYEWLVFLFFFSNLLDAAEDVTLLRTARFSVILYQSIFHVVACRMVHIKIQAQSVCAFFN